MRPQAAVLFLLVIVPQLCTGDTTTPCPSVCPSGWITFPLAQTDHCYYLPPKQIELRDFWETQKWCASIQPTSYILEPNTWQEETGAAGKATEYLQQYATGDFFVWFGAYYQNGAWHWLSGAPTAWLAFNPTQTDLPTNGTCAFWDPKSNTYLWKFRPCADVRGTTACEMAPYVDCSATYPPSTTKGPYVAPDCERAAWSDYTRHSQKGYLSVGAEWELAWLTNMNSVSCAVACMYYDGCMSYDIDTTTGDCRLLQANTRITCSVVDEPIGEWQHYDRASGSM